MFKASKLPHPTFNEKVQTSGTASPCQGTRGRAPHTDYMVRSSWSVRIKITCTISSVSCHRNRAGLSAQWIRLNANAFCTEDNTIIRDSGSLSTEPLSHVCPVVFPVRSCRGRLLSTIETEAQLVVSRQQGAASIASPHLSHFRPDKVENLGGHLISRHSLAGFAR
jgi:hypothetical protein